MHKLDRLLRPRSIAVIGGGAWCEAVVLECQKIGFNGAIWPVHPKRDTLGGIACCADLSALPSPPDAVFIGVNRHLTVEMVRKLSELGAGGAICFASGFSEATAELVDGGDLQAELVAAAGDMPILGPNCYGLLNALDNVTLWPDQHGLVPVTRGAAIITQSSNIAVNMTMQARGLEIAYVLTAGNQAQTDISEMAMGVLQDPRVTALGLYIEGIADLERFQAMANMARALGKPIVAVKAGKSDHAQAAAVSHTASMAGSAAGASALLRRLGIGEATNLPEFMEALKLLHLVGPLASNRIGSMSCSGGEASLVADLAETRDISLPPLDGAQHAALSAALGPKVALANPLDYHTYIWGDGRSMGAAFAGMMQGDLALGCVIVDYPRADRCDPSVWDCVIEGMKIASEESGKPLALVSSLPENLPETVAAQAISAGLVPLNGIVEALSAIEIASQIGQVSPEPLWPVGHVSGGQTVSEVEAKTALAAAGLRVPRSVQVNSPNAAGQAAEEMGYPVVLKGEGVAHKSDAGAVCLNLMNADAVRKAAETMPADAFLVEEMITGTVTEILLGVTRDPAHGFVLTLGAGGIWTEILRDTASLLLPTTDADIRAALGSLKIAPILNGYRNGPPVAMDALVAAVLAVQEFVRANQTRLIEVEVNPILAGADFAIAADALLTLGDPI